MLTLVWRSNPAGPVVLEPRDVDRLSVHASTATDTACRDTRYRCTRAHGDIDITPAGAAGGFDAASPSRTLDVVLPRGYLAQLASELGQPRRSLAPRHAVRDVRLSHLIWALEAERGAAFPAGLVYEQSLTNAIAVHVLGLHAAAPVGRDEQRLTRVRDYIAAHLDQRLSLDRIADVAEVTSSHLREWFKARTGVSVHRYVVRERVARAQALLLHSRLSISEVALASGFAHATHMARWLRRELGVTPRELRPGLRCDAARGDRDPASRRRGA